jgi:hypothetical protein
MLAITCRHCHSAFDIYSDIVDSTEKHFLLLFPVFTACSFKADSSKAEAFETGTFGDRERAKQ